MFLHPYLWSFHDTLVFKYYSQKADTNSNLISLLASSPKQRWKITTFHMASIKSLWFQMNVTSWHVAHSTVLHYSLGSFKRI